VDGEAFLEFTENSLVLNFKELTFGQRRTLLKIANHHKQLQLEVSNDSFNPLKSPNPNVCGNNSNIIIEDKDLQDLVFIYRYIFISLDYLYL